MHYWGVLPAAGTGRRFGGALPKQYAPLAGLTVLEWSLQPLLGDARFTSAMTDIWLSIRDASGSLTGAA